jgi:hypothetical protein
MRRHLAWLMALPLAAIGTLAGHSFAYRAAVPDPHERGQLLASTGHGYLEYAPLVVGACVAVLCLAFAVAVLAAFVGRTRAAAAEIQLVAAVPPLAFVIQELLERFLHDGHVHWSQLVSAPFLLGLAAQLPIALLVASLAYSLTRVAEQLGLGLRQRPPRRALPGVPQRLVPAVDLALRPALSRGYSSRGPPLAP